MNKVGWAIVIGALTLVLAVLSAKFIVDTAIEKLKLEEPVEQQQPQQQQPRELSDQWKTWISDKVVAIDVTTDAGEWCAIAIQNNSDKSVRCIR